MQPPTWADAVRAGAGVPAAGEEAAAVVTEGEAAVVPGADVVGGRSYFCSCSR